MVNIKSISQCEAYLVSAKAFGQQLVPVMSDLKAAIDRAAGTWRDDSIQRAQADVANSIANLQSAFSQLQSVLQALKNQVDWARAGQKIH
ncbi:MAG: hypothetical protein J6Z49_05490 [Kiritimatiellae bacterium]|nr:hypothetical protein [Kiritimatiellia bacterium]